VLLFFVVFFLYRSMTAYSEGVHHQYYTGWAHISGDRLQVGGPNSPNRTSGSVSQRRLRSDGP
jgi:hypothetical protein